MQERILDFPWSTTPLGRMEHWSPALRNTVSLMLGNRFPMLLWWGPEYIQLYNDAYIPVLGVKHPSPGLGRPCRECWAEIWDVLAPLVDTPFRGGPPTWMDDLGLEIHRHGYFEESHFTVAYSPVTDESAPGGIGGVLAIVTEITEKVVAERRVTALRDLGAAMIASRTAEAACRAAAEALAAHDRDVPFALLYLMSDDGRTLRLAARSGGVAAPAFAPSLVALDGAGQDQWPFAEVLRTETPRVVRGLGARFGKVPPGPWADPPDSAVVLPIRSTKVGSPAGVLVAGVSARLRFDDYALNFLEFVAGQIATGIAGARAYEEEQRRLEALAEIDRLKTTFFTNVSHEFRTPLTLMLSPLEDALAGPDVPPAVARALTLSHRNGMRLLKLVNTLLDFSRIEAGRIEASFEPVDLAAFTADLASNFRSACDRAGLELRVDCATLPEPVFVDRDMWEKVVLNLLSNAFKFTLEGAIEVRIESAPGAARMIVRDTGVGIPEDELPRMFRRFHRIQESRGRTHEGTGIGLSLVQELVRIHGGTVGVESVSGAGSTFTVTIPTGSAHLDPARIGGTRTLQPTSIGARAVVEEALRWLPGAPAGTPPEEPLAPGPAGSARHRNGTERARILWADDNADMREYVQRLLGGAYEVIAVADGVAALEAARERAPDLVLSDVMMPRLDGFGLLRALREDPATAEVPVILLSARAGEESRIEGMEAGADDYLVKPFGARELLARVGAHLELSRVRREAAAERRETRAAIHGLNGRLTQDLAAMTRLQQISTRLVQADDLALLLDEILDAALEFTGADLGTMQLLQDGRLTIASHRGFGPRFLDHFATVRPGLGACGTALESGTRVIVEDVETSPVFAGRPELAVLLQAGVRAVQSTPLVSRSGEVLGMLSTHFRTRRRPEDRELRLLDTLARQAADSIERKQGEIALRESARRKDEFLAILAHELRNPLGPVRNAAHFLRLRDLPDPELRRPLEIIERQVGQMTRLIDDLLDVSRISRGMVELRPEILRLGELIEAAVDSCRADLDAHGHRLRVVQPAGAVTLRADRHRLIQVFGNLLANAVKFTPKGGAIEIETRVDGDTVEVSFRDDGVGIPREKLGEIFELFAQVERSLERQGGLGIGLTLARQLVELHRGTIEARSDGIGHGSTFVVRLPRGFEGPAPAARATEDGRLAPPAEPRRVLIAEDGPDAAESLALLLQADGHEVRIARDGEEALAVARDFRPDVAFLDIGMPKLNGYRVAESIRAADWGHAIHLVAVTGWGAESDRRRSEEAGFDSHLVKPAPPDTLRALLRERPAKRSDR